MKTKKRFVIKGKEFIYRKKTKVFNIARKFAEFLKENKIEGSFTLSGNYRGRNTVIYSGLLLDGWQVVNGIFKGFKHDPQKIQEAFAEMVEN